VVPLVVIFCAVVDDVDVSFPVIDEGGIVVADSVVVLVVLVEVVEDDDEDDESTLCQLL